MSFLDDVPDLSRTVFDEQELTRARSFLLENLGRLDPDWLRSPAGPLGENWKASGNYATSYLIHFSQILRQASEGAESRSVSTLENKVRSILRPPSRKTYEENFTELETAGHLAQRVSPIYFEPLALSGTRAEASRLRSPDYGILMPNRPAFFEVTCPTFGFINSWETGAAEVAEAIEQQVQRCEVQRSVNFTAPITASRADLRKLRNRALLDQIMRVESGERRIAASTGELLIQWKSPMTASHTATLQYGSTPISISMNPDLCRIGPVLEIGFSAQYDENLEQKALSSIRNSLAKKRGQAPTAGDYVLVLRFTQLNKDAIAQTLLRRIFPNPHYAWITAVILFQPMRDWGRESPAALLELIVNEKARVPISPPLRQLLRGEIHVRAEPVARAHG